MDGSCSNMGDVGLLVSGVPGVAGLIPGAGVTGLVDAGGGR